MLTEESQDRPLSPARSCDIKLHCSCQESYVSVAEITNSYIMIFHVWNNYIIGMLFKN